MKIGEIVAASVIDGLVAKLQLGNPEELRIAYPVIVQGERYDFYCLVEDVLNEASDIADQLAGSTISDVVVPRPETHEGYGGPIFYSKAKLRMIQLIDRESKALSEPQTIPPYFAECRHATKADVERIYEPTAKSAPLGTITGVEPFYVHVDMEKLVEKPFAIFGRTGTGKSILNKLVCAAILAKDAGSVLIFDMHGEYGVYSKTDGTEGLKYYFPAKVEIFSLDPKNAEARPFVLDPDQITPEDLVIAFQDLTPPMIDHIYQIYRTKPRDVDLVSAIRDKQATEAEVEGGQLHLMVLQALQRRMGRFQRFPFIKKGGRDAFSQMLALIREGKSVVLDFGDFGTDQMVYLFVANVLARRLFDLYTEQTGDYPRLVLFLEEAHKFLDPRLDDYSIFTRHARETRNFNLIHALIDQRPSRNDDEVRRQHANRLVNSHKEPSDVESALAGVPDKGMWVNIVAKLPLRTVAVLGDAIRIPTVIDVLKYEDLQVHKHLLPPEAGDEGTMEAVADHADDILGKG